MMEATKTQPTNGTLTATEALPPSMPIQPPNPLSLTPRQRQRLAEDEIEAIEARYNVRVMGVAKTISTATGPQQLIVWEVVPLPDKEISQ